MTDNPSLDHDCHPPRRVRLVRPVLLGGAAGDRRPALVPTGLPVGLERMLALVIVTPGIHWVHHHAARTDTDSNYGTLFSFWDRIIRTRSPTRRMPTMAIGVEGEDERALPVLLARPFRRRR